MRWLFIAIMALFTASTVPLPKAGVDASVIVENRLAGHGSGIFISPTQVLTAHHVAIMGGDVRDVTGGIHNIIDVVSSEEADLAIITVDHPYTGVVPKITCKQPNRGDVLHYYGNPGSVEFVGPLYLHFIGGRGDDNPSDIDLADGVIVPGSSGSGVMNESGSVVGLVTVGLASAVIDHHPIPTGLGGYVSFHYPEICDFVTKEVHSKQYMAQK